MNGHKSGIPENALDKHKIMDLIFLSSEREEVDAPDYGDLASYAEMHFGPMIFNEGFDRYTDEEVQRWYYGEYLRDRKTDIKNGYDRGQV